jgi:transposase
MEQFANLKTGKRRKTAAEAGNIPAPPFPERGEEEARAFFRQYRWKDGRQSCPRCGGQRVEKVRRNRLLCPRCRYEFGDFTGTYLGLLHVGCMKWYGLIRLFDLEFSARRAAAVLGLSYPTVLKGFQIIRQAIAAQDRDFPVLGKQPGAGPAPGSPFRGLVFGIREKGGRVRVEALPDFPAAALAHLQGRPLGRSHIAYTRSHPGYDSLFFCAPGPGEAGPGGPRAPRKVCLGEEQGFRAYAQERLLKYRGVTPEKFPLYLKELEFRYNHRDHPQTFALLAAYVTRPVAHLL